MNTTSFGVARNELPQRVVPWKRSLPVNTLYRAARRAFDLATLREAVKADVRERWQYHPIPEQAEFLFAIFRAADGPHFAGYVARVLPAYAHGEDRR